MNRTSRTLVIAAAALAAAAAAQAQACPDKNLMYWQVFPPGGESDLSACHQQIVLKKKCAAVEAVIQYKAGDGIKVIGVNLPHIVLQPMAGTVQYKTEDVTPVFCFHYTPDILVVPDASPIRTFAEFIKVAKADPGKLNLGGSGLNSANHAAPERMNRDFGFKTTYVPFKGTGDMTMAVPGSQVDGALTYTPFAFAQKGKVRGLAVAMDRRYPLLPDVPTFKELGVDWVDGACRGIGVPKSTPPEARKRLSDLWAALNSEPEMKELAAMIGFELVNVGVEGVEVVMKDKSRAHTAVGRQMGLGAK